MSVLEDTLVPIVVCLGTNAIQSFHVKGNNTGMTIYQLSTFKETSFPDLGHRMLFNYASIQQYDIMLDSKKDSTLQFIMFRMVRHAYNYLSELYLGTVQQAK